MDELIDIELLCNVLLGEKNKLHPNTMQVQKSIQSDLPPSLVGVATPNPTAPH